MNDPVNQRKTEHLQIIRDYRETDRQKGYFDAIRLIHRALPELNLEQIDPSTTFLNKKLAFPLMISPMTGGDSRELTQINRRLAKAAEICQVAMGVGSQRILFSSPGAAASFNLRPYAPTIPLIANLGAVQLNQGFGIEECRRAVDVLQADALCLHLNPLQEAVQQEGNTRFANLSARIAEVARTLPCPVLLKEVGCGFSPADAELAIKSGIKILDIAGAGGTSWSRVEHHRGTDTEKNRLALHFQDWGIPTPEVLRLLQPWRKQLQFIASGGLRNGTDLTKAIILGAEIGGIAAPLLPAAHESHQAVVQVLTRIKREFVTTLFLLSMQNVAKLRYNADLLLS